MDLFLLIIRLIGFAVTLYLLLEFVVDCKVPTMMASILALCTGLIVLVGFILLKRYNILGNSCIQNK